MKKGSIQRYICREAKLAYKLPRIMTKNECKIDTINWGKNNICIHTFMHVHTYLYTFTYTYIHV